jgi:sugar lactone lactonase YvrE
MAIAVEVFDSRRNQLGEGPTATGIGNNHIQWCDIYGQLIRSKDLVSGAINEYQVDEAVGFQIPRSKGGDILGTANGPVLRDIDGKLTQLPSRQDADGNEGAFYRLSKDGKKLTRLFGEVGISNGMDWSKDLSKMYYIDTLSMKVDVFDYSNGEISNRRTLVNINEGMGFPDGMCADDNDNIWVAFWLGSAVRCFDGQSGKQLAEVKLPVQKVTSCCFAGEKLDQLIITSAVGNPGESMDLSVYPQAGFTFIASVGVKGKKTTTFGA